MPKWILLVATLSFMIGTTASAQILSATGENGQNPPDSEAVQTLIDTLEDQDRRQELIRQLKLMVDQNQKVDSETMLLDELFDIDASSAMFTDNITGQLKTLNISTSSAWNILVLLFVLVIFALIYLINRWLIKLAKRHLRTVNLRLSLAEKRLHLLLTLESYLVLVVTSCIGFYLIAQLVLSSQTMQALPLSSLLEAVFTLFIVLFVFALIWEGSNAVLEAAIGRRNLADNARIQTLLPIIRNILLFTLTILVVLVLLSEFGIDIMPLLAGAGVVGIAIGFGAQTLVKDFLTGFMIIFENLLKIGDIVNVADRTGIVEAISIRKIQLRNLDGTVHTVPFGEITIVDNLTRDFSFYLMDIGIAYREDVDQVMDLLREIGEDMRNDPDFGDDILEDLQIFGVDQFADSAVIIKARIKTRPMEQWRIGREFNRRMKHCFDSHGIEIPFPHQTIYFGEEKGGGAPPAYVQINDKGAGDT